jgi:hypothetical protein
MTPLIPSDFDVSLTKTTAGLTGQVIGNIIVILEGPVKAISVAAFLIFSCTRELMNVRICFGEKQHTNSIWEGYVSERLEEV